MADDTLLSAAGRIADGEQVDWGSITSSLPSEDQRAIADELAVVQQIAAGHRQLHQLLPVSSDTPPNLMPDRARWGHLDLLNIVGRGSYGTVYRAWDTRLERLVALKLFHGASDPEAVMQEGRMLARVRHENVVTVYGADVVDGVAGLWMELIHGETLEHHVKTRGAMTAVEAATLSADVAEALGAVHSAGLLHCDIKAQNVVKESGGRVVLMDLGAGRVVPEAQDSDQLSDVAGTPRYMAPELFHGGATATRSTDVYSFGVMLYFLVSGAFPVDGKSLGELKQAHAMRRSNSLDRVRPGLPPAFLDLVSRATDRDPAQRPKSAAELQTALAAIAAPIAVPAAKPRSVGWWAAAAAAVVLLALVVARPIFIDHAPPASDVRSIAVLPIKNLTGDPAKAYIADGMTEVLISNLARIRSFRVQSFAAVNPYRDGASATADTAKKLGVELLLAGSVTHLDSRMLVTLTLIDGASGVALWSDELSRDASGLVSGQSQLIRNMANALGVRVPDPEPLQARLDAGAEDAYLRGLARTLRAPAETQEAVADFRTATQLAPQFAPAWAELALAEVFVIDNAPLDQRSSRVEEIRQFANRAIQLDPKFSRGYAARGLLELNQDWNFDAAEQTFRTAITEAPDDGFIRQRLAFLLAARGRLDEAIRFAQEGRALEPMVASRSIALAAMYYYARDFRQAEQEYRRALAIEPNSAVAQFGLGRVFADDGRAAEGAVEIERALARGRFPEWLAEYARVLVLAGRTADAQRVIDELTAGQRQPYLAQWALIAAAQGDVERAFTLLDRAVTERSNSVLWLGVDPRVDPLRTDPRFDRLLTRIGLR